MSVLHELSGREEAVMVQSYTDGWQNFDMPRRQYNTIVAKELDQWRRGISVVPYQTLVNLLNLYPLGPDATILDVGCSSGYYSKVLKVAGIDYKYTGLDYSRHFQDFANETFGPSVNIIRGDATDMSAIKDQSYDVVITGGMLMHCLEYEKAISEIQRVARSQIIWHRTPVSMNDKTRYYIKEAYGLKCIEIHFNEAEIFGMFERNGWSFAVGQTVSWDEPTKKGQISYLFRRVVPE